MNIFSNSFFGIFFNNFAKDYYGSQASPHCRVLYTRVTIGKSAMIRDRDFIPQVSRCPATLFDDRYNPIS